MNDIILILGGCIQISNHVILFVRNVKAISVVNVLVIHYLKLVVRSVTLINIFMGFSGRCEMSLTNIFLGSWVSLGEMKWV